MTNNTQSVSTGSGFGIGHRIVGPVFVFVALALGAAQWVQSGQDGAAIDPARAETEVSPTVGQFEYFPAQYVNQAKQAEEHIQAF